MNATKTVCTVGLIITIAATSTGCATVETGQVGVKTTFGNASSQPLQPGLHLAIPGIDWVTVYTTRAIALPEEFTSLTKDGQSMKVTATATYSANGSKAPKIFEAVGNTDDSVRDKLVVPVLLGAVKDVISRYTMFDVIENQTKIADEVSTLIKERLKGSDLVAFQDFTVTGFVLDPEVQKAIEGKQIANQQLERKKTEVEIAKQEAARLNALQGSITPQTLMKEAIEKWDGTGVPPTLGGQGMNLLIQPK